jgi:hypothetical protein
MRRNLYLSLSSTCPIISKGTAKARSAVSINDHTYQLRQVNHISNVLKQPLCDDESPGQRLLRLLLDDLFQHVLQVFHIIVLVPPNRAPANLHTLPDREVDSLIRNNDVATLREGRNDARYGRERLRVYDACGNAEVCSNIRLRLHMYVLRAVEARRTTRADAICAESLDGFLFQSLVCDKVIEVVGGEVRDGAAVGEFRLGTCWATTVLATPHLLDFTAIPDDHRSFLIVLFLVGRGCRDKRFGRPVVDQFVNLLFQHQSLPQRQGLHNVPRL